MMHDENEIIIMEKLLIHTLWCFHKSLLELFQRPLECVRLHHGYWEHYRRPRDGIWGKFLICEQPFENAKFFPLT